jgi:hypothetical protein
LLVNGKRIAFDDLIREGVVFDHGSSGLPLRRFTRSEVRVEVDDLERNVLYRNRADLGGLRTRAASRTAD